MNQKTIPSTGDITLKPTLAYWIINNTFSIIFIIAVIVLNDIFTNYEILRYVFLILSLGIIVRTFYNYIDTLICTSWVITDEQITIHKGVFSKSKSYIELYRVTDYEENKSFIQALTNNTNVTIISGDKSTPELRITGIKEGTNIVNKIRQRVELQKQIKGIFEATNKF